MPMIVNPAAPQVTLPERTVSPDGWLAATLDTTWAGVVLAVDYTAGTTPLGAAANVRKVRITRTNPDGTTVPVRGADTAWAVEGVGSAYDHEAPLGVPVIYTATPLYADGTEGPVTSLAVQVPAPLPGAFDDLWLKSLDVPGLSMKVMIVDWPGSDLAGRQDSVDLAGSPYRAVAYDVHSAATVAVTVDVPTARVEQMRKLLGSGVLLAQTRPAYLTADAYFVPGDISEKATGKLGAASGYQYVFTITPIERPDTAGQRMRMPGWSYDQVAATFATYNAVAASYPSYAALATNGVT